MSGAFNEAEMLMSSAAIARRTGKPWPAWIEILDAWDASAKSHAEIARYLSTEHGVGDWDAQGVTVGYERARGLRPVKGNRDGTFAMSASKTYPVPVAILFDAFTDDSLRQQWLKPDILRLRTSSMHKSARFDQLDGVDSILAVSFIDKGASKSSVQVQEDTLPSKDRVDERRALWKDRLAQLARFLDR
jgi:hypothetical protein